MLNRSILKTLCLAALVACGSAHADYSSTLSPNPVVAPATYAFGNSTNPGDHLAIGTITPATPNSPAYNFLDQWNFTLAGDAALTSLAASFSFANTFGLDNLQVNLLNSSSNTVAVSWLNVVMNGGFATSVALIPITALTAGDYSLQVRGLIVGEPASYAGTLIATPTVVPLPAALPLMLAGLGLFGAVARRKRN